LNIILIVCDTLRADHLGCYGYFRETSPNIDRIASEGVLFEDFYNAGSPTGPGFTSIITGLHTIHHKYYRFMSHNIRQVDDTIFTMAEIMRAMGYTTAALDNLVTQPARAKHFVRGYEFYINCGPYAFDRPRYLKAEQVNRRLIPWIKSYSDEKFFLFVHYWDPHMPYNQPEEYRRLFSHKPGCVSDLEVKEAAAGYEYVPGWGTVDQIVNEEKKWLSRRMDNSVPSVDLYDGEIAYMDHAIGEVIETLENEGVLDETLVIVTSDHGEQLGQHNIWGHAALHEAETRIPLIMRYPKKLPRGIRVKGFCQQIDLLPTLLDLLDVSSEVFEVLKMDGVSVMPLLEGKRIRDTIFMEHSSGQRSIRTERWHYLDDMFLDEAYARRPRRPPELYNVVDDPMEVINLAEIEEEKAQELRETLQTWVRANLKEGETDPAIYEDRGGVTERSFKYREIVNLLYSLKS